MNQSEKLPEEFKSKWVAALRSGEYKQTDGELAHGGGYCCLGVACIVSGIHESSLFNHDVISGELLADLSDEEADIYDNMPSMIKGCSEYNNIVSTLTGMNDAGEPFTAIADYIESNL